MAMAMGILLLLLFASSGTAALGYSRGWFSTASLVTTSTTSSSSPLSNPITTAPVTVLPAPAAAVQYIGMDCVGNDMAVIDLTKQSVTLAQIKALYPTCVGVVVAKEVPKLWVKSAWSTPSVNPNRGMASWIPFASVPAGTQSHQLNQVVMQSVISP